MNLLPGSCQYAGTINRLILPRPPHHQKQKGQTPQTHENFANCFPPKTAMHAEELLRASHMLEEGGCVIAAIALLKEAIRSRSADLFNLEHMRLHTRLGYLYRTYTENVVDERSHFRKAFECIKSFENSKNADEIKAYMILMISETYLREGDFKQANFHLCSALEFAHSSTSKDCINHVSLVQSSVHVMQGDLESARQSIAIANVDKQHYNKNAVICLLASAHIELRSENWPRALQFLNSASEMMGQRNGADQSQSDKQIEMYHENLNRIYGLTGYESISMSEQLNERAPEQCQVYAPERQHQLAVMQVFRTSFCYVGSTSMMASLDLLLRSCEESASSDSNTNLSERKTKSFALAMKAQSQLKDMMSMPENSDNPSKKRKLEQGTSDFHEISTFYNEKLSQLILFATCLERTATVEMNLFDLESAQKTIIKLSTIVSSTSLKHLRPEFVRIDLGISAHCLIAKYLWRCKLPALAVEHLEIVRNQSTHDSSRMWAALYACIILLNLEDINENVFYQLKNLLQAAREIKEKSEQKLSNWIEAAFLSVNAVYHRRAGPGTDVEKAKDMLETSMRLISGAGYDLELDHQSKFANASMLIKNQRQRMIEKVIGQTLQQHDHQTLMQWRYDDKRRLQEVS
eukprot:768473-Hanusia_phi.AAC.7